MTTNIYRLDQTHMSLRLVLLAVFFGTLIVGIFVAIPIVDTVLHVPTPFDVLTIPAVAAVAALGISWAAEKVLTRAWPSGRTLCISNDGMTLNNRGDISSTIRWDQRVNVTSWHFVIRRGRAWVPKGTYCVACQLKQDDILVVPYAFLKPKAAAALPHWKFFPELLPRKKQGKNDKEDLLVETPEQAQLRLAEEDRWHFGVEMTTDDFIKLVEELHQHVPDWQAHS